MKLSSSELSSLDKLYERTPKWDNLVLWFIDRNGKNATQKSWDTEFYKITSRTIPKNETPNSTRILHERIKKNLQTKEHMHNNPIKEEKEKSYGEVSNKGLGKEGENGEERKKSWKHHLSSNIDLDRN